jgi:hypothetical protein
MQSAPARAATIQQAYSLLVQHFYAYIQCTFLDSLRRRHETYSSAGRNYLAGYQLGVGGLLRLSPPPSTVHLSCKNVDDDIFVVGTCNNYSYGTPLHLREDCEITAVAQTERRQWEWEGPMVVTHRVPASFVIPQTFKLDSDDSGHGPGLVSHFLVHIAANADGSFTATMDHLSLGCGH